MFNIDSPKVALLPANLRNANLKKLGAFIRVEFTSVWFGKQIEFKEKYELVMDLSRLPILFENLFTQLLDYFCKSKVASTRKRAKYLLKHGKIKDIF